jgi:hypothetical protein
MRERNMTAREFAAAINRPYPTVALWLRQGKVPGAYQESVGDFSVWQIPSDAVKDFQAPKLGRPKKEAEAAAAAKPTKGASAKKASAEATGRGGAKAAKKRGGAR